MIVEFDKSFAKSINKINDDVVLRKIARVIEQTESTNDIAAINNIKKLSGLKNNYYRIRIGDYRVIIEKITSSKVRFILVAHRREVYRKL